MNPTTFIDIENWISGVTQNTTRPDLSSLCNFVRSATKTGSKYNILLAFELNLEASVFLYLLYTK